MEMNGPQLKAVLERAYRNYYYYKYVPGYGGYSYYTTCMIDINAGGQITYVDLYNKPYDPNKEYVVSLVFNGHQVNFKDAKTYYRVSTVNYLAAGSCNFNDNGVSLWPLDQIVNDTQFYVRDSVIHYIQDKGIVSPAIEGRLQFVADVTTQGTIDDLNAFYASGQIDNQGVYNTLLKILQQAQKLENKGKSAVYISTLNSFINAVQAQSGKHIAPEAAAILIADARWLINK
jgi:hypothetical protein